MSSQYQSFFTLCSCEQLIFFPPFFNTDFCSLYEVFHDGGSNSICKHTSCKVGTGREQFENTTIMFSHCPKAQGHVG